MILDELVLHNVGVFAGYQAMDLTPPRREKPITVIGGLNGCGKTTIRDAIHLALYGPLAQASTRRTGSYDSYLRSLIHHATPPSDGAAIELAFHAYREGVPRHYRVRRSWWSTGLGIRDRLDVTVDGKRDETLTTTWPEYVESFLPRGIAGLFFFDGEQIESLADLDRSREVLSSALAALLGLDLVDRLASDLTVLRRRHRARELPDELRHELTTVQAAVTAARQAEEVQGAVVATARVELERASKRQFLVEERYRDAGGSLVERRDEYERSVVGLREEVARIEAEMCEAADGATPLLLVADIFPTFIAQVDREIASNRNRVVADELEVRDRRIIEYLRAEKVRARSTDRLERELRDDRETRRLGADDEPVTGLVDSGRIRDLAERVLPEADRQLRRLLHRRDHVLAELEAAERLLAVLPDPEALVALQTERDEVLADVLRAQAALAQAEDHLVALRADRARAETKYERVLENTGRASLSVDDDRRLVDHVDRVQNTLGALKRAATERHVGRISGLVLEALGRLLRKGNLISELAIDPATCTIELRGATGQPLTTDQLSAGERQLLAVALLWGLAEAAGQPLPVVIDTPLGRLDQSHRHHLLDSYFPSVSHQVILLSTDTEIDQAAYARLKPSIGHSYCLDFDPATCATSVRTGYFWEQD